MSSPIIGYSSPGGEPAVRGYLAIEVAIIVRAPTCPICGSEHRFLLTNVAVAAHSVSLWLLTCPLAESHERFLVRVMNSSVRMAQRRAEEMAALVQLGMTWELGLTWAPASIKIGGGVYTNGAGELIHDEMSEETEEQAEA